MKSRKIDENLNVLLRLTLEKYKDIESPAAGLFSINDIYARPPYFAFRFKNGTAEDYGKIKNILLDFRGLSRWTLSGKVGYKNQLIEPLELKELRGEEGILDREFLINQIGQRYFDICDAAAEDIEPLSRWIESKLLCASSKLTP